MKQIHIGSPKEIKHPPLFDPEDNIEWHLISTDLNQEENIWEDATQIIKNKNPLNLIESFFSTWGVHPEVFSSGKTIYLKVNGVKKDYFSIEKSYLYISIEKTGYVFVLPEYRSKDIFKRVERFLRYEESCIKEPLGFKYIDNHLAKCLLHLTLEPKASVEMFYEIDKFNVNYIFKDTSKSTPIISRLSPWGRPRRPFFGIEATYYTKHNKHLLDLELLEWKD